MPDHLHDLNLFAHKLHFFEAHIILIDDLDGHDFMRLLVLALEHARELAAAQLPSNRKMVLELLVARHQLQDVQPLEDDEGIAMVEQLHELGLFDLLSLSVSREKLLRLSIGLALESIAVALDTQVVHVSVEAGGPL